MDIRGAFYENSQTSRTAKKSLPSKVLLFILAALLPLGYTLAANINLGGNNSLEFGQGIQVTTACDDQIFVKPGAEFDNRISKSFGVKSLEISDIANSCIGKALTIDFYGETSSIQSNSYGSLVLLFTDSGTTGLHFELKGDVSTPALINTSNIDTSTAGSGANGSGQYRGSSSLIFSQVLSSAFGSYKIEDSTRVTIQTSEIRNTSLSRMTDTFVNECVSLTSTNIQVLDRFVLTAEGKVQQMLALADFADYSYAQFMNYGSSTKHVRAQEFWQLSVSGKRVNTYIDGRLRVCDSYLNNLWASETDLAKRDSINAANQAVSDAIDSELAAYDAFNALASLVAPHL